jgi:hypothetical protein
MVPVDPDVQKPKQLTIHYTAMDPKHGFDDVDHAHRSKGWKRIGYHRFVEAPNGSQKHWSELVKVGRPDDLVGAGVYRHNQDNLHIAVADDAHHNMTDLQKTALVNTIIALKDRYNIPWSKVNGHKHFGGTLCPGKEVDALLTKLKKEKPKTSMEAKAYITPVLQKKKPLDPVERFNRFFALLMKHEGGYSNHPKDRGGATKYGITQSTYSRWLKDYGKPWKHVSRITKEEAKSIYFKRYYTAIGAHKIVDDRFAYSAFDTAVLFGVNHARKLIVASNYDTNALKRKRIVLHRSNPNQSVFRKGWEKRTNSL